MDFEMLFFAVHNTQDFATSWRKVRKGRYRNIKEMTLGSLFDGIGGFPYAASFYGIRPLWASEVLPECISITKKHFPEMEHLGDITKINGGEIPPVDLITFGSPCQGLSLAGKRQGLADQRSALFMDAVRIIYEMKEATHDRYPRFILWENVPGALSSAGGRDYQAVLEAITKSEIPMPRSGRWANAGMVRSGGTDLAWCVYNAQYFGTAQRRRRVFLVADFTGKCAAEILFIPKSLQGYFAEGTTSEQKAAAFYEGSFGGTGRVYCIAGNIINRRPPNGGNGAGYQKELAYTLTASDRHVVTALDRTDVEILNDQGGDSITVERSGCSPTLRRQTHGNLPIVIKKTDGKMTGRYVARRLIPLECERLQGFPDGWTSYGCNGEQISDNKRYQMLGNSIAVPCAAYILQGMKEIYEHGAE